jgi:hypothetical protein
MTNFCDRAYAGAASTAVAAMTNPLIIDILPEAMHLKELLKSDGARAAFEAFLARKK